ncbi:MAG: hypothetical protein J5756_07195 [Clostridia bacterium]|nr:hypothetical protein [Clostridia bacterium]MBR5769840.1 hypothetical protein [Clostridia bacterium]
MATEKLIPIVTDITVPEGATLTYRFGNYCEFAGESSATKSDIKGASLNSSFWEQDTGDFYHLTASGWEKNGPEEE